MPEKSEFDKALGELYDLTEWEDAEAAIRELHAQAPAMSGVLIAAVFFVGVCIYNPWDETAHRCGPASQEPRVAKKTEKRRVS